MNIFKSIIIWIAGLCIIIVLFPLTFIIWLICFPFDRQRFITHWVLVYQSILISKLIPGTKIEIEGRQKAAKGTTYVIIANHQSILDILLLNCLKYRYKWISKIENTKVPVLGWYLRMAGYITVDRGNEESKTEMLEKSYQCLKKRISIMIFPEGTRFSGGGMGFFKRGAFQLAIQAGIPILPVVIDGTAEILPRHGHIFGNGSNVKIKVLDPVEPSAFGTDNPDVLAGELNLIMKAELNLLRTGTTSE